MNVKLLPCPHAARSDKRRGGAPCGLPPVSSRLAARPLAATAFTLIELLVVIAVVAILMTIVIAATGGVRERIKTASSLSNLRQIGAGTILYLSENDGTYPPLANASWNGAFWTKEVGRYIPSDSLPRAAFSADTYSADPVGSVFMDPFLADGHHHWLGDYGSNDKVIMRPDEIRAKGGVNASSLPNPSRTVLATSAQRASLKKGTWYFSASVFISGGYYQAGNGSPSDRDTGGVFTVFCDGHTEIIPAQTFYERRREFLIPEEALGMAQ